MKCVFVAADIIANPVTTNEVPGHVDITFDRRGVALEHVRAAAGRFGAVAAGAEPCSVWNVGALVEAFHQSQRCVNSGICGSRRSGAAFVAVDLLIHGHQTPTC